MDFSLITSLDSFNGIVFNEYDHTYTYNGKQCISVTTLLGKFKKKFETEKIASRYAAKNGLLKEDVINDWAVKNKEATDKGSELHKYAEYKFSNKHYNVDIFSGAKSLCHQIDKFYDDNVGILIPVKIEFVVGDYDLGICGTLDKLFYNTRRKCLEVWDYKTNKNISKYSKYGNRMTNGLSHLIECEFNTYSLQTSIYRKIIEKNTGIKLGDSYVCWINESNESYKVIKMDYLEREVGIIFNTLGA